VTADWFDYLKKDFVQGFPAYCGFKVDRVGHGEFETSLVVLPHHRQQDGFAHAGVIATMADHTAGYAAFTTVTDAYRILTIEFKINYFRPARGKAIVCRSKVIKPGKQIIVSESEVFSLTAAKRDTVPDERGKLVSKALVTLMAVPTSRLGDNRP
jgi:uncharacterized protein (TIGR00369 family)